MYVLSSPPLLVCFLFYLDCQHAGQQLCFFMYMHHSQKENLTAFTSVFKKSSVC